MVVINSFLPLGRHDAPHPTDPDNPGMNAAVAAFLLTAAAPASAFVVPGRAGFSVTVPPTALSAIGLGPSEEEAVAETEAVLASAKMEKVEMEVVEPNHEDFRMSRLSKMDHKCDAWYGALLGDEADGGHLGAASVEARRRIMTLPELKKAVSRGSALLLF